MVPDFQTLMRPVLNSAQSGEVHIGDVVQSLADEFELDEQDRTELVPSGKQTRFANRVHWARTYLKQAGLLKNVRRGHFKITESGLDALKSKEKIDRKFLEKYPEYVEFKNRERLPSTERDEDVVSVSDKTPDEVLRLAYQNINDSLAREILDRVRESPAEFFEKLIVELLLKMGYGTGEDAGHVVGQSGDDGVDGVINQDSLGVDQVYIQAKRYAASKKVGSGAIRDFYGALGLKDVTKGIFVTTSSFSTSASETAQKLGARIVLIDGYRLAQLMIQHEVGCRVDQTFSLAKLDEGYFE